MLRKKREENRRLVHRQEGEDTCMNKERFHSSVKGGMREKKEFKGGKQFRPRRPSSRLPPLCPAAEENLQSRTKN